MTISEWTGIVCAVLSLIAAIIIAVLQYKQAMRMENYEKRQDERDENRHAEEVKSKAVSSVSKYYNERGFIPLCAIAAMYNEIYYYNREMFREFCCCTTEVQNKILEYSQVDLRINEHEIYPKCIEALNGVMKRDFKNDENLFYDGGKYIGNGIVKFGNKPIPYKNSDYTERITDLLSFVYREKEYNGHPIQTLKEEYGFDNSDDISACQFSMVVAKYIAIYKGNMLEKYKDYETPPDDDLKSMEDLFLDTIFEIYTNLVI